MANEQLTCHYCKCQQLLVLVPVIPGCLFEFCWATEQTQGTWISSDSRSSSKQTGASAAGSSESLFLFFLRRNIYLPLILWSWQRWPVSSAGWSPPARHTPPPAWLRAWLCLPGQKSGHTLKTTLQKKSKPCSRKHASGHVFTVGPELQANS